MARNNRKARPDLGPLAPQGFLGTGLRCGLKRRGEDLALLYAPAGAVAAGAFTSNLVRAAAVVRDERLVKRGRARAVIVNSGNANACTGRAGAAANQRMARVVAKAARCAADDVLTCSTGIIGEPLAIDRIEAAAPSAFAGLGSDRRSAQAFARAIMTTDKTPKTWAVTFQVRGRTVRVGGAAKGAGMIAPHLATMLAFLTTDARISPALLRRALKEAVANSFNSISVDGHTSTNDTVLLLASGAADAPPVLAGSAGYLKFRAALGEVAGELARMIVKDGEGATKLVEVQVTGARNDREARRAAEAVTGSPLVLAALNGGDPNWGRIVSAAGYSGARFRPERAQLRINGHLVFRQGTPTLVNRRELNRSMKQSEIAIVLALGAGAGEARMWCCDLSREYIRINAHYHT